MSPYLPTTAGWHPDVADFRDYTLDHPDVGALVERMPLPDADAELPPRVDLRDENDMPTAEGLCRDSACCACAVLDLVAYLERKLLGRTLEG